MVTDEALYIERHDPNGTIVGRLLNVEVAEDGKTIVLQCALVFTQEGQWRNLRENPELFTGVAAERRAARGHLRHQAGRRPELADLFLRRIAGRDLHARNECECSVPLFRVRVQPVEHRAVPLDAVVRLQHPVILVGKYSSRLSMPSRCSAVNVAMPCVSGTRKSCSPWITSIGVRHCFDVVGRIEALVDLGRCRSRARRSPIP